MLGLDKILKTVNDAINAIELPTAVLPPSLLYCTAIKRSGSCPSKMASDAIVMLGDLDFAMSEKQNQFIYTICNTFYKSLAETSFDVSIPPGIPVTALGGNGGGPVIANGFTTDFGSGKAIMSQKEPY